MAANQPLVATGVSSGIPPLQFDIMFASAMACGTMATVLTNRRENIIKSTAALYGWR
ncbi:hypothetical protein KCP69_18650 [Salmonella enterica subsp. enterica]|nr:hypothetical protein KCP69_18650 [Salmonella enterica subsp. enterica]